MEFSVQIQGIIAQILSQISWGIAAPVVKVALNNHLSAGTFVFLRILLSLIILGPFILPRLRKETINRADWPKVIAAGFFGIPLNIGLFFWGLSYTTVVDSSVISATVSIFTAVAAFLFLKEKISHIVSLGIIISFAGTIVIILQPILEQGLFRLGNLFGNVLILFATLAWVGYTILNREIGQKYDSFILIYISFLIGVVCFLPFAAKDIFNPDFYFRLTPFLIFAILFETIVATILSYFLFTWGLKYVSATTSGIISYVYPIVAILASIIFLGEKLTMSFVIGTTLVVIGLFISEARHAKHPLHKFHSLSFPRLSRKKKQESIK